jgi:hypothetical protein
MHRFRYASNTVELISCELLQDRRADRLKPERPQPQKGGTRGLQSVQGVTWRFLREGPRQQTQREKADASGGDARSEALQVRPQTTTCPHSILCVLVLLGLTLCGNSSICTRHRRRSSMRLWRERDWVMGGEI